MQFVVPGNVHISATEGIGNSVGREESQKAQNVRSIIGIIRGVEWGVRKHPFRGGDIDNIQNYIQ